MINPDNISKVFAEKKGKMCIGLEGKACFNPRREKGWLCPECHKAYMRDYMRKKRGTKKRGIEEVKPPVERAVKTLSWPTFGRPVEDKKIDYEFNQEWRPPDVVPGIPGALPLIKKPLDKLW